jgi:hypothetical protein
MTMLWPPQDGFPLDAEQDRILGDSKQAIKRNAYSMRKAMVRRVNCAGALQGWGMGYSSVTHARVARTCQHALKVLLVRPTGGRRHA